MRKLLKYMNTLLCFLETGRSHWKLSVSAPGVFIMFLCPPNITMFFHSEEHAVVQYILDWKPPVLSFGQQFQSVPVGDASNPSSA